jgi:TRAP-type C4-dicarboxylate transport system permease small subunit
MKFVNGLVAVLKKICYYLCYASMFIIVVMMILMSIDAIGGLFFNYRVKGSYEVVQMILSVLVFTSWGYTQTQHGHIHVVMFIKMFPEKVRVIIFAATSALSTVVMIIGSMGVYRMILDKMAANERTANLLIPFWPFYLIEFISFIIFAAALFSDTLMAIAALTHKEAADELQSTWV